MVNRLCFMNEGFVCSLRYKLSPRIWSPKGIVRTEVQNLVLLKNSGPVRAALCTCFVFDC